jgi:hypothetical protein
VLQVEVWIVFQVDVVQVEVFVFQEIFCSIYCLNLSFSSSCSLSACLDQTIYKTAVQTIEIVIAISANTATIFAHFWLIFF